MVLTIYNKVNASGGELKVLTATAKFGLGSEFVIVLLDAKSHEGKIQVKGYNLPSG